MESMNSVYIMKKQLNEKTALSITKTDCWFQEIKWVCKAVSKDETREPITVINIEKDSDGLETSIVATDGRRLHILTLPQAEDWPAGRYKSTVTAKEILLTSVPEDFHTFPNWQNVIPNFSTTKPKDFIKGTFITGKVQGALISGFASLVNRYPVEDLYPHDRIVFNDSFLSDLLGAKTLLARKKDSVSWDYEGAPGRPLVITSQNGIASLKGVIMPMVVR